MGRWLGGPGGVMVIARRQGRFKDGRSERFRSNLPIGYNAPGPECFFISAARL